MSGPSLDLVSPGRVNNPPLEVAHAGEATVAGGGASDGTVAGDTLDHPSAAAGAQESARVAAADAIAGIAHTDDGEAGRGVAREAAASRHRHSGLTEQAQFLQSSLKNN